MRAYLEVSRRDLVSRRKGEAHAYRLNVMLAVVDGLRPEYEAEAKLAVQMAVAHVAAMNALTLLKAAEIMPLRQLPPPLSGPICRHDRELSALFCRPRGRMHVTSGRASRSHKQACHSKLCVAKFIAFAQA
jgi:hypothetical protein